MKHALIAASLVLGRPALAAGCGGGDDSRERGDLRREPQRNADRAPRTDFCEAYNSLFEAFADGTQPTDAEAVKAIKKWADDLDEVGTPEDIPADAQKGFELIVATVQKIEDDATQADMQKLTDGVQQGRADVLERVRQVGPDACPLQPSARRRTTPAPAP